MRGRAAGRRPSIPSLARLIAIFCVCLLTAAGAVPREDRDDLRARIGALEKQLAESREDQADASDALKASERAISNVNRELAELARRGADAEQRARNLKSAGLELETEIDAQQRAMGELLVQRYRNGRAPALRLLLSGNDPNRIARQLHYYSYIARAQAELLDELRGNLAEQEGLAQRAAETRAELTEIERARLADKQQLEQERAARRTALALVARQITEQRREITSLQRDETRLTRLIERIEKIVSKTKPPPRPGNDNEQSAAPADAFQQLRGKLDLPVRGELAQRFGSPRPGGGLVWKGLFIRADSGQQVKAVARGRVVFADWLRGFGNLMIVDHGDSYMSLYGNNETLYKQVGDAVARGEQVAAVGNSGGNPNSGLYFEMRYRGKPFDPLSWLNSGQ